MKAPLQVVVVAMIVALVAIAWAQAPAKPVSEQDLVTMLGLGLDAETIVSRVKKTGIAFEANDAVLAKLKTVGAADAVLAAVKELGAKAKPAATPENAVTYDQVLVMLSLGIDENGILTRLSKSPTTFTLSAEQVAALKKSGATEKVLAAMQGLRAASGKSSDITDLAIILDCSGSMSELTTGRETKMVAAKRVVTDLVKKIPEGLNVTFVIYGHEVFGGAEDPRNCQAVKVARPLSPLDASGKAELTQFISRLQPKGSTPISLSLRTAGEELKKNDALCGVVLITDGLETCMGNPAAEAAALAANLKLSYGVNVVGFGVKPEENAALESIAIAGKGKYYSAADANKLAEFVATIAREIEQNAKPPEIVDTTRRAVRVRTPQIEMPALEEIYLVKSEEAHLNIFTKIGSVKKYDEYLSVPSSTNKYTVFWSAKDGWPVVLMRDLVIPDRRVVDVKPETILGMIQVNGTGKPERIYVRILGDRGGVNKPVQLAEKFGEMMVVPAGKYDIYVGSNLIEEGLEVQAGKLHRLQ